MSKKKLLTVILALGTILVFGAGISADADVGYTADEEICGELGLVGDGDAASWLADKATARTDGENLIAMGLYSPRLDKGTGGAGSTYVQFTPGFETVTIADLEVADTDWGFWYFLEDTASPPGPHLELRFENPAAAGGWVDITIMAAQAGSSTLDAWTEVSIVQATVTAMSGGAGPNAEDLWYCVAGKTLAEVLAYLETQSLSWSADLWELTRVRLELWEAGARTCYVDDINIKDHVYDLEPCGITLSPPIAKNVKTADETFTVVDGGGFEIDGATVGNWVVARGQGTGDVITVAGGPSGGGDNNFITVRMVVIGDATITCDVGSGDYEVSLQAEKKWGEIYSTLLTAWTATPCDEQRPTGVGDTEITRAGIEVDEAVLVQEKVIAKFLPGPVSAPAGGAKITWWLLENDADHEAQTDLEELVAMFDSYFIDPDEDLGSGEGCGQYAEWATPPDVTFIPEDMIELIYAAYPAQATVFTHAECLDITDTTKTVTYTDHVGDPLGEGFTNTSVLFSDAGSSEAEPVIVVVLADYPIDKNGQNAVCVEYFKFTPKEFEEFKDVQTLVVDVITAGEIDPIRKDLLVFVRNYDGTPANPESVEFFIDGAYGLFEQLLGDTDVDPDPEPDCYPDNGPTAYPAGIFNGGQSATSTTRLAYADEKDDYDEAETGTGDDTPPGTSPLDLSYTTLPGASPFNNTTTQDGYAIAGVRIISSFKKCVDILIKVHDCHGDDHVIIIRDVMVCFGAPDSATRTYYSVGTGGWNMVSTPLDLVAPNTVATVYDELPGVSVYSWNPAGAGSYMPGLTGTDTLESEWGWWIYLAGDATITVEGTDPPFGDTTSFVAADFADDGWYQVSAPYTSIWDDTAAAGLEENLAGNARLVSYDPVTATYHNHYVGDGFVLSPWYSYWVNVEDETIAAFDLEKAGPSVVPSALSMMSAQRAPAGLEMPPAPPSFVPQGAIPEVKVELAVADGMATFAASAGEALKVQVFNLSGGLVYDASAVGSEIAWAMRASTGELVANGVYLAEVSVKTAAGWVNGGLFRILVLR